MAELSSSAGIGASTSNAYKERALRSLGSLPPFSPILNRLLASLAEEEVSFTKLADLIEKDPVVAGNLLQVVNSGLCARRGTVNSVRHALSLLGINKLRNMVLGMSIARMWNHAKTPSPWSMERFNLHAATAAQLADLLAQKVPVSYPEGAFVAGLLHDVGRLLIAVGLPEEHRLIAAAAHLRGCSFADAERELLGFTHADLSAEALIAWNLPVPIQEAVRDHESVQDRPLATTAHDGGELPLAFVVSAADRYVNSTGASIVPAQRSPAPDRDALASLGLSADLLRAVLADYETELAAIPRAFA